MVLLALFVGARLQGIIGMIFAIPIVVIIDTVLQELTLAPRVSHVPDAIQPMPPAAAELDEQSPQPL